MDEIKHKVTVEIFGEHYSLKSDKEAQRVKEIAALVDSRMKTISKANSRLSPVKVAVLVALNIAEEYLRLEEDYKHLVKMVKEQER